MLHPDAIFVNGKFHTLDPKHSTAEAIAVKDGRIYATGTTSEIEHQAQPGCARHDLGGRPVVPGLTDSHLHMMSLGQSLDRIALKPARSISEIKALLASKVKSVPPGTWVFGRGWDQDRLIEKRYPTRYDLDEAAPDNPVVLTRACGHVSVVNSRALAIAGVNESTPAPVGGVIDKDDDGRPVGLLRERAAGLVLEKAPQPTFEQLKSMLRKAMQRAVRAGVTSVHANDNAGKCFETIPRLYSELHAEGERLRVYWDIPAIYTEDLLRSPYRTGLGDEFFKYGAMKILIDGSLGGKTAALDGEYADDPGNEGVLIMPVEDFDAAVERGHRAGMQIAIHAIGDRGVRLSLDAIEKAQNAAFRPDPRHRIIHCQVMTLPQYGRFKQLGVVADVQPKFVTTDMLWTESRVGKEKAATSYGWKTFLDMGVATAGGSDCPVEPIEPMLGVYAAVTRCDMEGRPDGGWLPDQKIDIDRAIRMFALGGPYASFEETVKGSLQPGKMADFVVLDRDPYRVAPHELKDIDIVMTVIGGKIAYQ